MSTRFTCNIRFPWRKARGAPPAYSPPEVERLLHPVGVHPPEKWQLPQKLAIWSAAAGGLWGTFFALPKLQTVVRDIFIGRSMGTQVAGIGALGAAISLPLGTGIYLVIRHRARQREERERFEALRGSRKAILYAGGSGALGVRNAIIRKADPWISDCLAVFLHPPLSDQALGKVLLTPCVIAQAPIRDAEGHRDPAMAARAEETPRCSKAHLAFLNLIGGQECRVEIFLTHIGGGHSSETVTLAWRLDRTAARVGANPGRFNVVVRDATAPPPVSDKETAVPPEPVHAATGAYEQAAPAVMQIIASKKGGTGVVLSEDGLAITAGHVVNGVEHIEAAFSDGQHAVARLVAIHAKADLAVLHIEKQGALVPAVLGDSRSLRPGDRVAVLGFPASGSESAQPEITDGIVSALVREGAFTLIQTTAPINPGNSGGPLVNERGEVVGIVVKRMEQTADGRPIQGVGFALASQDIEGILQELATSAGAAVHANGATPVPQH